MIEPIEVLVPRRLVESRHVVHAAISDTRGNVIAQAGQPGLVTFWRSSAKPIQALPFVAGGGMDAFDLSDADIAIMCASHHGEPFHVKQVEHILQNIGYDESYLRCGAHPPLHGPSAKALAERGEEPRAVHCNCSGKHAGMLALTKLIGADPQRYLEPSHPAQQRILETVAAFSGVDKRRRAHRCGRLWSARLWPAARRDGDSVRTACLRRGNRRCMGLIHRHRGRKRCKRTRHSSRGLILFAFT